MLKKHSLFWLILTWWTDFESVFKIF